MRSSITLPMVFSILLLVSMVQATLDPIGNQVINENEVLSFNVTTTGMDLPTLVISADGVPVTASFIDNLDGTGTFTWTPNYTESGNYSVTFNATDVPNGEFLELINIEVLNVNRVPVITAPLENFTTTETDNFKIQATATDEDGDVLTYDFISSISGSIVINNVNGTFEWATTTSDAGVYDMNISVTDGIDTVIQPITITIKNYVPVESSGGGGGGGGGGGHNYEDQDDIVKAEVKPIITPPSLEEVPEQQQPENVQEQITTPVVQEPKINVWKIVLIISGIVLVLGLLIWGITKK